MLYMFIQIDAFWKRSEENEHVFDSARRPTESAWLENVVDLEEAKVFPKQVSQ